MKKYILIRENSHYSYPFFILGIYDTKLNASLAKNKYVEEKKDNDKYKEQSYKKVNLIKDVIIKEIDFHGEEKDLIYVLISRASMMGQVIDEYLYIGTDIEYLERIEKEESKKEENDICCFITLKFKNNHNYFNSDRIIH